LQRIEWKPSKVKYLSDRSSLRNSNSSLFYCSKNRRNGRLKFRTSENVVSFWKCSFVILSL
jgi:hypothetical protein